jgi:predicted nucleic acid-binding protein
MILTDSGYWLALANQNDQWHSRAVEVTQDLEDSLVVTWPVITETCYLLLTRLGVASQTIFMGQVYECVELFQLNSEHIPNIQLLMTKYANLPMDLADASLVIAATELNDGRILSTDQRDFGTYRWKNHHPFENLLLMDL